MEELWTIFINQRAGNTVLVNRLHVFSEMIKVCLESQLPNAEKLKIIGKMVRISSELQNYRRTADGISVAARNFIETDENLNTAGRYVLPRGNRACVSHEHLVPCSVLARIFVDTNLGVNEIYTALLENGIRVILIRGENDALRDAGLNQKMPQGWVLGNNPFLRYQNQNFANTIVVKPDNICP